MKWLSALIAVILALSLQPLVARADIPEDSVEVVARRQNGALLAEASLGFEIAWSMISTGDPLTLKYPAPLSIGLPTEEMDAATDRGDWEYSLGYYSYLLKHPAATTACPFPLFPTGHIFHQKFDDGAEAFFQVAAWNTGVKVTLSRGGRNYEMTEIPHHLAAGLMLQGAPSPTATVKSIIEVRMAVQECRNILAAKQSEGQLAALLQSAQLIGEMLELYKQKRGRYPVQICHLYAGPDAVVGAMLSNPYRISENFCASEISVPRPAGSLKYFVQTGDGGEQPGGYFWLAVLCDEGNRANPAKPLASWLTTPSRAVYWIEPREAAAPVP